MKDMNKMSLRQEGGLDFCREYQKGTLESGFGRELIY